MADKKEIVEEIYKEIKESYNRNLNNVNIIDSKLTQLFTFATALLLIFINTVDFPQEFCLIVLYLITILIFISTLYLIMKTYAPAEYYAINSNEVIKKYDGNENKDKIDLLKDFAGRNAEDVISIKENCTKKTDAFKVGLRFILMAVIFLIFLKIFIPN
ncbi:MAG: hypothetical protein KAQ92_07025 [Candidatus Aenigmarchaeota archaeon]|nr:hypothetical protein [Candidatus Aenigmarchaeota archaeon]